MLHLVLKDKCRRPLLLLVGALISWPLVSEGSTPAIGAPAVVAGSQQLASASPIVYGWSFSVAAEIDVVRLGWYDRDKDGLVHAHDIALWDMDGNALGSGVVPQGVTAALAGSFRYIDVTPLRLHAGETYVIGGLQPPYDCLPVQPGCRSLPPEVVEGTQFIFDLAILDTNPQGASAVIANHDARFAPAGTGDVVFPSDVIATNAAYLGPSFEFLVVPEPPALVILTLGCLVTVCGYAKGGRNRLSTLRLRSESLFVLSYFVLS